MCASIAGTRWCQTFFAFVVLTSASVARGEFYFARAGGEVVITNNSPPLLEGIFGQFVFIQDGQFTFETLVVNFTITDRDPDPDDFAGTCLFTDAAGETLAGAVSGVRYVAPDGLWSGGGEWSVTGGSATYAGITGGGTFTFGVIPDEQTVFSTFEGTFVPAPPAGLCVLALGALTGARRRR